MKTYRHDFQKGINVVGDKAIIGSGFVSIADNCDLRSGAPRALNAPTYFMSATAGTTKIYEYRGKWIFSSIWKDYVAEYINGRDRIYYTEDSEGESGVSINVPKKSIEGTEVDLGIKAPSSAPMVRETTAFTSKVSASITAVPSSSGSSVGYKQGNTTSFRLATRTAGGVMPPSQSLYSQISSLTASEVDYTWNSVVGAIGYRVYIGSTPGDEQFVTELGAIANSYKDVGTGMGTGEFASVYDVKAPYSYMYTLLRDVKTVQDESGPSNPSHEVTTSKVRSITFDSLNDGVYSGTAITASPSGLTSSYDALGSSAIATRSYDPSRRRNKFVSVSSMDWKYASKVYFDGFVDSNWNGKSFPIIVDSTHPATTFYVKNVAPPTDAILTNGFATPSRTWITVDNTASNGDAVWVVSPSGIKTGTYAITAACATGFEINVYSATTQSTPTSVKYNPGNNYLKYRNLYRVGDTSEWSLVAQVPITEGTFDDSFSYQNIEGGTPDSFYQEDGKNIIFAKAPPALTCLTSHYGMLFGISGHTIRWTPIGRPDAWPEVFSLTMPFQPLALASFNQALVVLCYDAIYRLDGNVPTRISLSKTKAENGCIAPHSVQKTHSGLVYLSKLGPMLFDGERAVTITATKIPAQFFQGTSYRYSSSVEFWARPTLSTYNYVNLCNHDGLLGKYNTNPMVETNPRSGPNYNVRSFYSNGKYTMFWVDGSATNYTENTMVTIDLQVEGFPVTTSSVKLLDAFVSDTCNTYALLRESHPDTWEGDL